MRDQLPMNRAQPFFLPPSDNPHPWTDAIAQDAGWIWKIPLQHRYGCGYVYDENYISNEDVKKTILQQYPDADIPDRVFKFEAGYFEEQFIKNCVSIGLASNFVEPLEATSIFSFLIQLSYLDEYKTIATLLHRHDHDVENYLDIVRDSYNIKSVGLARSIANFIQLHYITSRGDTQFWKDFKNRKKFKELAGILEAFAVGNIDHIPLISHIQAFAETNYVIVGHGNKLINCSAVVSEGDVDLDKLKRRVVSHVHKYLDQKELISMVKKG